MKRILQNSPLAIIAVALGIMLFYACSSVPYTKRSQLSLVPNNELISMAKTQYGETLKSGKVITKTAEAAIVKRVGERIKTAVEQYMAANNLSASLEGYQWEFNLLDDPKTVNAWCMPGGKVAFYTGIMPICKDEAGVAVVMGHEVAHAVANHGRERMSQQLVAKMGVDALAGRVSSGMTGELLMQAVGMGTQLGMLKFSRDHESEADHLGLVFMAMAGYNPEEAPKLWQRMASIGGNKPMEFLSTHPSDATRISNLNGWMNEAKSFQKK